MISTESFAKLKKFLLLGLARCRYPFSMPAEISADLGFDLCNSWCYYSCLEKLKKRHTTPRKLYRYMPREEVESVISHAYKKESFRDRIICSYYFKEGWVEFELYFDHNNALRRVCLKGSKIDDEHGIEMPLASNF